METGLLIGFENELYPPKLTDLDSPEGRVTVIVTVALASLGLSSSTSVTEKLNRVCPVSGATSALVKSPRVCVP